MTPDGRVVVAWTPAAPEGQSDRLAVARLTAAGAADPTFGTSGVATVTVPNVTRDVALAAGPFGTVYVAGRLTVPGATADEPSTDGFAVARLTAAGAADPAFGANGVTTIAVAPGTWNTFGDACRATVLRDGRVVVAGQAGAGYGAVRLLGDGRPGPTFGANGVAVDPSPVTAPQSNVVYAVEGRQVEGVDVLPDGRVVFAGSRTAPGRTDADAELVALTGSVAPASPAAPVALVGGPADGTARGFDLVGRIGDAVAFFPGSQVTVRTTLADVTGDGVPDLIGGAGPGGGARVRVLDGETLAGVADFLAFEPTFTGGVFVAAADFDGDGEAEVVVTPDLGGGPVVAVFDGALLAAGKDAAAEVNRFFGIEDPAFRGGARAAAGDLDGDGTPDLVVAAGFEGGPRVAVFSGKGIDAGAVTPAHLLPDFFAFEDTLRNGAFVSAGDVTGDGRADVAFGGGPGGAPRVRLFDGAGLLAAAPFSSVDTSGVSAAADFFAGDSGSRGGVHPLLRDAVGDGDANLVAGSGDGEPARVRVYRSATPVAGPSAADQDFDPFAGTAAPFGVFVG